MTQEWHLFVGLLVIGLIFMASNPIHAILLAIAAFFLFRRRSLWSVQD